MLTLHLIRHAESERPPEAVDSASASRLMPEGSCANRSLSPIEPISAPPKRKLKNSAQRVTMILLVLGVGAGLSIVSPWYRAGVLSTFPSVMVVSLRCKTCDHFSTKQGYFFKVSGTFDLVTEGLSATALVGDVEK